MTGPEMDELVEVGARALGTWHGDEWDEIVSDARKENYRLRARAILTAVLPRVLQGPREALDSNYSWLSNWADHIGKCKGGIWCTCGLTAVRYEARSALDRLNALLPAILEKPHDRT